ncbi:putative [Myosin heavy-chain] kinase transcription factor WD40-like family [Helianthus annuus]|nr:putative [Myosin heavy-chain] kinase transcription factor WD40-like family [Helianthus annuus]
MKNVMRRIMQLIRIIPRKSSKNIDSDDEDDHFYDAQQEPSVNNHRYHQPLPPLSDTDSLFGDGSRCNSYQQSSYDRLPMSAQTSPLLNSPWSSYVEVAPTENYVGLLTSLVREEGHIYSLAATTDLLYTGSSSKNIRIWKHHMEYSGFKSHSGLVKAIVVAGDRIFTGHQDGKIRVWRASRKDPKVYKKIATLPDFQSVLKKSLKLKNYTEVRRKHSAIWIKHFDAISSMSLNDDHTLLYSGSWDKTMKVWRVSDFKCLESISAHDDVINAVVAGAHGYVFSGSADGTLKVWRKESSHGKRTKHYFSQSLLKQEFAVTSLVVTPAGKVVYAGCSDGVVHYWEHEKLIHGGVLRGHKLAVLCLAASGYMVFSGSADKNICVWQSDDRGRHRCLYVLNGHTGPVKCLAVEKEARQGECGGASTRILYSGSLDKSVKIWRVCPQMLNADNQHLPPPSPQRIDGLRRSRVEIHNKLPPHQQKKQ